jgi:hypothetical protein
MEAKMPIKPRKKIEKQQKTEIESWKLDYLREGLLPEPQGFFMLDFCFGPDALKLWREIKDDFLRGTFPYAEKRESEWVRGWGKRIEREVEQQKHNRQG